MASEQQRWAVIPLRDMVVFPHQQVPFIVGRPSSIEAVRAAAAGGEVFLLMQRDPDVREPGVADLHVVGTLARVVAHQKLPDGTWKLVVEGRARGRASVVEREQSHLVASVTRIAEDERPTPERAAAMARLRAALDEHAKRPGAASMEVARGHLDAGLAGRACDDLAARLPLGGSEKQRVLETADPVERLTCVEALLQLEDERQSIEQKLQRQVQTQVEAAQREYILQEKLKAIHKELGRKSPAAETEELLKRIEEAGLPQEAKDAAIQEVRRLESMPAMSSEASVVRTHVDWILALPWSKSSEEIRDLAHASRVLEEDHHGLKDVKERILEHLAVRSLKQEPARAPLLCFVGPPGVGKTSLGRSIARATGRTFARVSLGGVRDEAEIRGHRRTYVGAYPGRILQMLRRAGARNPVLLLDEVDKLSSDFRGDPSSALLEVLDPEQNSAFLDHYLDVPFDLSDVLFLCTANVLTSIPEALRDRLEIVRLPGYTLLEKEAIARRFLIPRQVKEHGLPEGAVVLADEALRSLIEGWTREAGVRSLEREIAALCRKAAARIVRATKGKARRTALKLRTADDLPALLGQRRFKPATAERTSEVGLALGLAWTETGGQVLVVEATNLPGTGKLLVTGQLGSVMQESLQAALSWVRSRAAAFGLAADPTKDHDIHVHVPEGAIPKDGPSAGVTLALAVLSALTGRRVRHDVAMTGEITLRGRVLAVGGLKEKLLAAHRYGVRDVLVPADCARDLEDVPEEVRHDLRIRLVSTMDEVVEAALLDAPLGALAPPLQEGLAATPVTELRDPA